MISLAVIGFILIVIIYIVIVIFIIKAIKDTDPDFILIISGAVTIGCGLVGIILLANFLYSNI